MKCLRVEMPYDLKSRDQHFKSCLPHSLSSSQCIDHECTYSLLCRTIKTSSSWSFKAALGRLNKQILKEPSQRRRAVSHEFIITLISEVRMIISMCSKGGMRSTSQALSFSFGMVLLNINAFNAQLVVHENKQASTAHIWTLQLVMGEGTFLGSFLLWSGWQGFFLNL